MKLDKICRTCLSEKAGLKPLFSACVPSMLMSCASVQVMQGDGLPQQICTQCIQSVNRSYSFKQLCEKSENILRDYLNGLELQNVSISSEQNLMNEVKTDQLLSSSEVLQHSSIFQDIFNDATTHSLVDTFTTQNANAVVSDLAETMQSLQTIAEQCLPETWETDTQLMSCHSNSETNCSGFNLPLNVIKCQFCGDIFKDEWSLGDHMKTHTGQSKHFCAICGNGCNTPAALNKHILEHTLSDPQATETNNKKQHECAICCKNFSEAKQLKKHLNEVHFLTDQEDKPENERKFVCNVCGKRYKQNKLLTVHMRIHTGERPLSCEVCGRTFSLPSSLLKHRNIHTGEKKYECTVCGKKFNQSSNLNSHLALHTGSKSFICAVCGKAFATNINLEVHTRIHTGEKPFGCTSCDKAFASDHYEKVRTLGDGMDNSLMNNFSTTHKALRECTVHLNVNSSKKILKSLQPVEPSSEVFNLVPKYVPKVRKQPKYLTKKLKEPKFVPYEPYKGAVEPIIPYKQTFKACCKQEASNEKAVSKNNVEIYELVTQLSELRATEMNKNKFEAIKEDEIISKRQWEKERLAYETDIKNLRETNAHLENQLKLQSQVNSELKTLLVAAVGEDLETRVQHLTEDKLQLARALLNSANHLTSHQEQVEWLSGQCEVWRSKFLASSLMVEELARWKSALTSRTNELQTTLRNVLEDRTKVQNNTIKVNNYLTYVTNNITMENKSFKPDVNKLKQLNIIELTNLNTQLCERITSFFGMDGAVAFTENVLLNHTSSEKSALKLLQNPVCITNKQELVCNAVVGAALSCGEQLFLQHPSSRATCCSHCTGDIKNI